MILVVNYLGKLNLLGVDMVDYDYLIMGSGGFVLFGLYVDVVVMIMLRNFGLFFCFMKERELRELYLINLFVSLVNFMNIFKFVVIFSVFF